MRVHEHACIVNENAYMGLPSILKTFTIFYKEPLGIVFIHLLFSINVML